MNETMAERLRRVWDSLHPLMWFAVMFVAGTVASVAMQQYVNYFVVTAPDRFASFDHLEDQPGVVNESQVVQVFACEVSPDILAISTPIGDFMASPQVVDTVEDGDFISLTILTTVEPSKVYDNGTVATSSMRRDLAVAALPSYDVGAKRTAKSCNASPSSTYVDNDSSLYPYGFPTTSYPSNNTPEPTHN